jgi:NADPH:quinone reductase-like Zn-dependent oxidoreductase
MGTRDELVALTRMLVAAGARPVIDRVIPLDRVADGLAALIEGDVFGKVVVEP